MPRAKASAIAVGAAQIRRGPAHRRGGRAIDADMQGVEAGQDLLDEPSDGVHHCLKPNE